MTRWARPGQGSTVVRNRKVCAATPWEELQQQSRRAESNNGGTKRGAPENRSGPQANKRKKKNKKDTYVNQDVNGFNEHQEEQDGASMLMKDQRREGRRLKRQNQKKDKMICFHCRKPGHGMADCSEVLRCQDAGTGICFRCGSTEHEVTRCRAKVDPALGEFPYAKCFICGEMGHLSRSCPDNPKGLYAEGGSCRICGSVEHFQRDCPEHQQSAQLTVSRWSNGMSADYEEIPAAPKVQKTTKKGPKIVTF
ncbi:zinc finger CCHC domain-containing protein 9 [Spea bombifrons]|uniref:zinc finger CCHC domain-containing protein 9 n=1 Tax=Spea bombifrons TaxID=233779 RepID=UPI00234B9BE8|nr:zinc finger CCHC domain-containing protein 9 [Spea bombifrons]